jgi:hypothetical protein
MADSKKTGGKETPKTKKPNPGAPATKAEHAALKRVDKMIIKRMRKR